MTEKVKKAIEQLERISNSLASIGETEDYTDIAIQALEQQPKTGHWIDARFKDEWYGTMYICSKCNGEMIGTSDFCPNCGAKMEEVDSDDN